MGAVPGEELAQKRTLAALLVKLEQRQEPETLVPLIDDVIGWFRAHPDYDGLKRLFTELVSDAIEGTGVPLAIPDDLREMRTMLATLGKTWREEWTAKGKAEGKHEAQVRILLRLLERRFGPVPEGVRETVEAADRETLDRWLDRILDAPTRDALFED